MTVEWFGRLEVHQPDRPQQPVIKDPPDRTGPEHYQEHDERL